MKRKHHYENLLFSKIVSGFISIYISSPITPMLCVTHNSKHCSSSLPLLQLLDLGVLEPDELLELGDLEFQHVHRLLILLDGLLLLK